MSREILHFANRYSVTKPVGIHETSSGPAAILRQKWVDLLCARRLICFDKLSARYLTLFTFQSLLLSSHRCTFRHSLIYTNVGHCRILHCYAPLDTLVHHTITMSLIRAGLDTLESRREELTKRFFKRGVLPETSCLHYLLPDKRDVSVTGWLHHARTLNWPLKSFIPYCLFKLLFNRLLRGLDFRLVLSIIVCVAIQPLAAIQINHLSIYHHIGLRRNTISTVSRR